MGFLYDRNGNLYKVEDETVLKRKNTITVFNEKGEELELPADQADEYKLTPDEMLQVINELKAKVAGLERILGVCPEANIANNPYNPYGQPLSQTYPVPTYTGPVYAGPTVPSATYGAPYAYGSGYPAMNPVPYQMGAVSPYTSPVYGPSIVQPMPGTVR